MGVVCAAVGLFIFPEILDSIAIIVGAYIWRLEGREGNRGVGIVILGIVCMQVGLVFTEVYSLWNFLP